MIYQHTPLSRQKGVVLVITALCLIVLMGMAALAIDLSHAYVNKTRLQNLADALALSAAISLNKKDSGTLACNNAYSYSDVEVYAKNYAEKCTLPKFTATTDNKEISDAISSNDLAFQFKFSQTLSSTTGNWKLASETISDAKFARVEVTNPMNIATWFAGVMGFNDVAVSVSAVAGTAPFVPCNNMLPILICAKNNTTDFDCTDGACYGYKTNTRYCFKTDAEAHPTNCPNVTDTNYSGVSSGNFGLMDMGGTVPDCAAGDDSCAQAFCENFTSDDPVTSKPGNTVAMAAGFNTRFDDYKGAYKDYTTYPPDPIVGGKNGLHTTQHNATRGDRASLTPKDNTWPAIGNAATVGDMTAAPTNLYKNYYAPVIKSITTDASHTPMPGKREVAAPFVDCQDIKNGKFSTDEVKGFGCFFLTEPMGGTGQDSHIFVELLEKNDCASGIPTSTSDTGFYKVQLYKDPFGGHS